MMWGWHSWSTWLAMAGFWLALFGLLAWLVVRLVAPSVRRPGPRDVLDERLARGEIDVHTYRELRGELER
jgi:putative membrane protein